MATTGAWVRFCGVEEFAAARIRSLLNDAAISVVPPSPTEACGIVCFAAVNDDLLPLPRSCRPPRTAVLAVAVSSTAVGPGEAWRLLHAGAADTLIWSDD